MNRAILAIGFIALRCGLFGQIGTYIIHDTTALRRFTANLGDLSLMQHGKDADINAWLNSNNGEALLSGRVYTAQNQKGEYFVLYQAVFRLYYFRVHNSIRQMYYMKELDAFLMRKEFDALRKYIQIRPVYLKKGQTLQAEDEIAFAQNLQTSYRPPTGLEFDTAEFQSLSVFFDLLEWEEDTLPLAASLEEFAPPAGSQCEQGSCVGWACSYGALSTILAVEGDTTGESCAMSSAFVFNQVVQNDSCYGTTFEKALALMKKTGSVPDSMFPYRGCENELACVHQPDGDLLQKAQSFLIQDYLRLESDPSDDQKLTGTTIRQIKTHIAKGLPVVVSIDWGGSLDHLKSDCWYSNEFDRQRWVAPPYNFTRHAVCIIAYDDNAYENFKEQWEKSSRTYGGFLILNSWGEGWGVNGIAWISYKDFLEFGNCAYAMYRYNSSLNGPNNELLLEVGVVSSGKQQILQQASDSLIVSPLGGKSSGKNKGYQLRIGIQAQCYVHVLEVVRSSYDTTLKIIFPGDHESRFFALKGNRLLPRAKRTLKTSESFHDYILLVTKNPVDLALFPADFNVLGGKLHDRLSLIFPGPISVLGDNNLSDKELNFSIKWSETNGVAYLPLRIGW